MVLQKRLDYGFNGYQVPPTPRAARSARRRRSFAKTTEENKVCAFDLLAIVAGNLLCETEDTPVCVKREQVEEKVLKVESHDQETNACSSFAPEPVQENQSSKESVCYLDQSHLGLAEKSEYVKSKNETETFPCKLENDETQRSVKNEPDKSVKVQNVGSLNTDKVTFCGEHIPCSSSYPSDWDDLNVVSRDDDENSSGCTYPSYTRKLFRPAPRIGDRRIRKILASKHWKVAPRCKNTTFSNNDANLKSAYRKKIYHRHQRTDRIYPFKKRKHFGFCSPSNSEGGISSDFVSDSLSKANKADASGSCPSIHGATITSSSVTGEHNPFQTRDSHVKLRIRSFKVPELFIEIPESATVGSLKRTVMEAVTAILGGGLRIGVLVQGKKVRDDSKTLLQTGISHSNLVESLGFSLEPNSSKSLPSLSRGDDTTPFLPPCQTPKPLISYCPTVGMAQPGTSATSSEPQAVNMPNSIESEHDSAPSPPGNMLTDKGSEDMKALVPVQSMNVEALAMVAPSRKQRQRLEIGQRRIRRPFSVAEVEALVQAVEKLGTGRWRDVKLRAFDDAKHRTYVDLKDKWKTLVHTARISPQQRRGEPVPQELLDRVLRAHAYWSQQQAKHHQLKPTHPAESSCLQASPSPSPLQALRA